MELEDDIISVFTYDDSDSEGAIPEPFNLTALTSVANRLFSPKKCALEKIAEGGFHKVYNVRTTDGEELGVVARVASPDFPKDKLKSEIATLKYIADRTTIPVPKVIIWESDATNEVGAEYMFLSKIPGVTAHKAWPDLPMEAKKNMVRQVAGHMFKLWELRFDAMGSLYFSDDETGYRIGPIVENRFCRTISGVPRTKKPVDLSEFRGPFSSVSSYLASGILVDLKLYAEQREDLIAESDGIVERVDSGRRAMEMALELCDIYPGDRPISNDLKEPISLQLEDFTLSNIMINPDTGDVYALIDFEFANTAPGWFCAEIPSWLRDEATDVAEHFASIRDDSSDEGDDEGGDKIEGEGSDKNEVEGKGGCDQEDGSDCEVDGDVESESGDDPQSAPTEEAILLKEFLTTMGSLDADGSWSRAYKAGRPYREFAVGCGFFIGVWGQFARGRWVESALRWLKKHPREGTPGNLQFRYPDVRDAWISI